MGQTYERLFTPLSFNSGAEVATRFAMSPMVAVGSSYEGYVEDDDVNYFLRRANTASLLITGATNVGPHGNAFGYGLGANSDDHIPGLKRLAEAMKSKGNKAILQIFHPGRQAKYTYQDEGKAYGPSDKQFSFLDYPVTGMTNQEVYDYVEYFGQATKRAIQAGFDGVEIHGANHYLIQQFYSSLSNERQDEWGGDRKRRAAFPLAVVKAVKEAVQSESTDKNFIIGYRISPEEIHGDVVGYNLDDSLYLIDQIAELNIDYIHTSNFGQVAYKKVATLGEHQGEVINEVVRHLLNGRAQLVGAGDVTSPDKALDALNYVDIVAMGAAAIIEPDMMAKIKSNDLDAISLDISGRVEDLALPKRFSMMINVFRGNQSVPAETLELLANL